MKHNDAKSVPAEQKEGCYKAPKWTSNHVLILETQ